MPKPKKKAKATKSKKTTKSKKKTVSQTALKPNSSGSKAAVVVELLERSGGVTITELAAKTGWQPHTCRAKISVLGKTVSIKKSKNANGDLVYRKVSGTGRAAAPKR